MTDIVGLTREDFVKLADDALAFRTLLAICRATVSADFKDRFSIGTNIEGDMVYQWDATDMSPRVVWTPADRLTEVEAGLMAAGYGAMVLFPSILATFDVDPDALRTPTERLLFITGPLLGTVAVHR